MASGDVLAAVRQRYGLDVTAATALSGGIESSVVRATGDACSVVIRASPTWRTLDELSWAYELASYAATLCPEALAPLRAADGALAFEHDGHVVSVFPYVEGRALDRTNALERDAAATLLASLHRVLPSWPAARARPSSGPGAPDLEPQRDPAELRDPALDDRVARLLERFRPALTHGDYYRGNVRCEQHRIIALFDVPDNESLHRLMNEWAEIIPATFDVYPVIDPGPAKEYLKKLK